MIGECQIYYYCLQTQPFKFGSGCFSKLDTTTFNVYVFIILISSWWIIPFSRIKWPSFPLMTNCGLKASLPYVVWHFASFWMSYSWSSSFQSVNELFLRKEVSYRRLSYFNPVSPSVPPNWRFMFWVVIKWYTQITGFYFNVCVCVCSYQILCVLLLGSLQAYWVDRVAFCLSSYWCICSSNEIYSSPYSHDYTHLSFFECHTLKFCLNDEELL